MVATFERLGDKIKLASSKLTAGTTLTLQRADRVLNRNGERPRGNVHADGGVPALVASD
jgi:hypothetical protein